MFWKHSFSYITCWPLFHHLHSEVRIVISKWLTIFYEAKLHILVHNTLERYTLHAIAYIYILVIKIHEVLIVFRARENFHISISDIISNLILES